MDFLDKMKEWRKTADIDASLNGISASLNGSADELQYEKDVKAANEDDSEKS